MRSDASVVSDVSNRRTRSQQGSVGSEGEIASQGSRRTSEMASKAGFPGAVVLYILRKEVLLIQTPTRVNAEC
eukprot:1473875-Pyramimonas_sp.AAC.1